MTTPKENLARAMVELGITVHATFVPWSRSRKFRPDAKVMDRSLNWHIVVKHAGREVLATDYTAAIGHAPSYRSIRGGRLTVDAENALAYEVEHGKTARLGANVGVQYGGKPITVDPQDVVYSLVSDSDAINHPSFESWARDFGYDTDSRTAEAMYRACLAIALKLRAAVGEEGLAKLREACHDY